MAKPSVYPIWNTSEVNAVEPDATRQSTGWVFSGSVPEKPPFEYDNFLKNNVYKWVKYLDEITDFSTLVAKTTPVVADELILSDSAAAGATKKITYENLVSGLISQTSIARPTKVSTTSISVDGTTLTISSPVAGTDYYFSKTAIQTVKDADTIGGFHYGLTPSGETPTGNKTTADITAIAGINQYSIWTNWFRPICEPEGMVHINGKWYDIYLLNSEHIINGTSKAFATIAGGEEGAVAFGRAIPKIPLAYGGDGSVNYGKLTWFQLCEIAKSHGKELISYEEYQTIAYGVLEGTDCSALEVVQGRVEHYATLTSKFGIEQATGVQNVWGKDLSEDGGTRAWQSQTDGRGQIYSAGNSPVAVRLGGARTHGVYAGSRNSYWSYYVWHSRWDVGCRFACDHLNLA